MLRPILLDTCAALWLTDGAISEAASGAIAEAEAAGLAIAVSPITAWEIGMLVSKGRITLSREPVAWFDALLGAGVELAPMAPHILVASSFLPGGALRDPADRVLAATARAMNYRLMTRDERLLDYATAGHLAAIAC
ncbi:MAG TPA: type II toxin-antitoxin system VapC family toxin [Caulobacteraceae bacterium]|nr:type II toxin-antitoxin system VapC family toxin [Caulobacteraceae bacterium]